MQKEVTSARHPEGLPVWVCDFFQIWPTLRIATSIPLGRLEWQCPANGHLVRDSSTAARAFFQLSDSPLMQQPFKEPHAWYLNPYVHIFVTAIRLLDKPPGSEPWQMIRKFVDICRERHHEYLVICAASDDDLERFKRTYERLRSDVNVSSRSRERVVAVSPAKIKEEQRPISHLHHSAVHRDLLLRLREVIRDSVQNRLRSYNDEVTRSDLNKNGPSWSYTNFFALKEGMAFVFVHLGRKDISIKLYESLHSMATEEGLKWRPKFCDLPPAEVALGVANSDFRDFRSLLLDDVITEVDLHTYLFSRQMKLLIVDHKFTHIAEKGVKLISHVTNRCSEEISKNNPTITQVFRDIWVFTTSRIISTTLAPSVPSPVEGSHGLSAQLGTLRERHTVRLVAGFHVHALKSLQGLSHIVLPGCLGPEMPPPKNRDALVQEIMSTANDKLKNALADCKSAEAFHSEIANAAASLYEMGSRARGAAALDGDAGCVQLRNGSFSEAEGLLSAQCARFMNDQGWDVLHCRQRNDLAQTERKLGCIQEYLVSCLTMLYMGRTSRLLDPLSMVSKEKLERMRKDSSFWVTETVKAAADLPRMMRYKSERLFQVAVLPNDSLWEDGSPASATVRITSDILAPLSVDHISLECKCMDAPSPRKLALHRREEASSPSSSSKTLSPSLPDSLPTSPVSPPNSESIDIVTLNSKQGVTIENGTNDIMVKAAEIPHHGRYRVNLVCMFLGKLKFVYTASKPVTNLVAVTQKSANPKVSPALSSTSPLIDFGLFEAQVPYFFASKRPQSGSVEFEEYYPLYLVPQARQYVHFKIVGGKRGIAPGAILTCTLLGSENESPLKDDECFVQFAEASKLSSDENEMVSLPLQKLPDRADDHIFKIGNVVIDQELIEGAEMNAKVVLDLLDKVEEVSEGQDDAGTGCRRCTLRFEFSWCERDGSSHRRFTNHRDMTINFMSPVNVEARVELNSEWGHDNVSRAVGLDGTPLEDGGTLVCSIYNQTKPVQTVNIRTVTLKTPNWLELRPDEEPAHVSLLPHELRAGGLLNCIFDVFVREGGNDQSYGACLKEKEEESFEQDAVKLRLPRMIGKKRFVSDGQDDVALDGQEKMTVSVPVEKPRPLKILMDLEASDNMEPLSERSAKAIEETCSTKDDIGGREAKDVVDLSSDDLLSDDMARSAKNRSADEAGERRGVSLLATLCIDLEIEGVVGWTTIERNVCMSSLRTAERRYGIERVMKRVGEVGKIMELEFRVWEMGYSNNVEEIFEKDMKVLQYEVDVDPSVWLVIGRQRGKVKVTEGSRDGGGGVGRVEIMGIACGRHGVPCIHLFEEDGRGIASSRHEIVHEYMQVVVVPCRTVVSACQRGEVIDGNGNEGDELFDDGTDNSHSYGNMPAVIESDSFFAS